MSSKAMALEQRYPRVSETKTRILELEQQLRIIKRQEEHLVTSREALVKLSASKATDQRWQELQIQILSNQSEKNLCTERLNSLKEELPKIIAVAERAENDLTDAKAEIEKIRVKITDIDKELAKTLKTPMALIESRKKALWDLVKAGEKVQDFTNALNWHPVMVESIPLEPPIMENLKALLPRQVVRFRG